MRRAGAAIAAVVFVLTAACTKDVDYGICTPELQAQGRCIPTNVPTTIPSSASATPTRTARPSPKPSKTVKPPTGSPGRTYAIVIRSSANGYEPRERVVYVGDTLTFENLDPNQKHTFTADEGAWDSGEMSAGDAPYRFKVNLPPGDYTFHCELVPYVLGGPIRVTRPSST